MIQEDNKSVDKIFWSHGVNEEEEECNWEISTNSIAFTSDVFIFKELTISSSENTNKIWSTTEYVKEKHMQYYGYFHVHPKVLD